MDKRISLRPSRRACLSLLAGAMATWSPSALAEDGKSAFEQWVAAFRARARARGISDATYTRVMADVEPDTRVLDLNREQPEFNEQLWQYLNRRVSDYRITTGKVKAKEYASLLSRVEKDYGVDRFIMLAIWGIESAFGDPDVQKNHMRPVIPALAALAWGEPRRRAYWEQELLNALIIIDRGWSSPDEMRGSWAGAMGHTQWMPEVWLNSGVDYDGDGRVSPFGRPDDAIAGTAHYLVERGQYRRDEHWGYEVSGARGTDGAWRTYEAWQKAGITRADGKPFPRSNVTAKLWLPVSGGPAFLLGRNFHAVRSYNPSNNYTLAIVHLADRIGGGGPFVQGFPGAEQRAPTLAEVQEIQQRLTALGFDTGGTDGRVGNDTMLAIRNFQRKVGMEPADGYAGLKLLARLRQDL
jgi:membrane-bound lytic murein transglycosylase B